MVWSKMLPKAKLATSKIMLDISKNVIHYVFVIFLRKNRLQLKEQREKRGSASSERKMICEISFRSKFSMYYLRSDKDWQGKWHSLEGLYDLRGDTDWQGKGHSIERLYDLRSDKDWQGKRHSLEALGYAPSRLKN